MADIEEKFLAQFGDELFSPSTKETLKPSDVLTGKKVMLYFSAHWCPPCRRFTPMLISLYKKLKEHPQIKDTFELVFVTLDRDEGQWKEYIADMPWKCLPFSTSPETRQKIAMKYKAEGIPHLVVLDENRNTITMEGVSEVSMDPDGEKFPWKPKTFSEIWPKQYLTKNDGLAASSTLDKKHLMLYFSAHWCPPCRAFTPKLSAAYTQLMQERKDDVELVFVSSDRDEESFKEYHNEMTFCALPYEEREAKAALGKLFGVRGIPALLILGPVPEGGGDRPLINDNLRGVIEEGDFSEFPFHPKPYQDLASGADGINEYKSLVVFCENEDDDEQKEIVEMVQKVAEKVKKDNKDDEEIKFFYATQPKGAVPAVRRVMKIQDKLDGVIMTLLDIPDNGGFYMSDETDLTPEKIEQFLANPGGRKQLS